MTPDIERMLSDHNLSFPWPHDNLVKAECSCSKVVAKAPSLTGSVSACCGAMEQRNGSCSICTSCGSTSACG